MPVSIQVLTTDPKATVKLIEEVGLVLCDEDGNGGDTDVFVAADAEDVAHMRSNQTHDQDVRVICGPEAYSILFGGDQFEHWCGKTFVNPENVLVVVTPGFSQVTPLDTSAIGGMKRGLTQAKAYRYGMGNYRAGRVDALLFTNGNVGSLLPVVGDYAYQRKHTPETSTTLEEALDRLGVFS